MLEQLRVEPDGSLSGPNAPHEDLEGAELVLLAELLGLLLDFIGERLTLSLVHEAWPDAPLEGINLHTEDQP